MKAIFKKRLLKFKSPSGTSRGILKSKETWYLILQENDKWGIGECGIFRGLSFDDVPEFEDTCDWIIKNIDRGEAYLLENLKSFPSLQFGVEQAFLSFRSSNPFELFETSFLNNYRGIPINGLVWMGDAGFMKNQIQEKLEQGFSCIKMKIGAIDFETEIRLLESIRNQFSKDQIELRVDANGAFMPSEALEKLEKLATLELHSIEQPIKYGQWNEMKTLCAQTPLPIALDEELIGLIDVTIKKELLLTVKPQYIILKPSLVGGFKGSMEWIKLAEELNIGWWITSALESNVGLNAIAQWTATLNNDMPQGLGTGGLFTNNIDSPLEVKHGGLYYNRSKNWDINMFKNLCT
ncbi:o-succinylbenzoate synthase [Maribacter sp. CXY002]|uniref:o-succinylbenzoate synthase n=1 Tax=Maribacter luteocoastalis TaxID=3407671 RepID=UPI003B6759EB